MKTIIIKTQAELDALPKSFAEFTVIEIRSTETIIVREARESSSVVARESSRVVARESSRVVAWGSSSVEARESSRVVARESSRVEAWGSSSVVAWGSSSVEACESSRVEAWGSSRVEAWGSSRVEARESSRVVARESSSVVARESSRVVACESSRVEAWGSSRVEAWGSSSVHNHTDGPVLLFAFSVAWLYGKAKATCKSNTAKTILIKYDGGVNGYLDRQGVEVKRGKVVLFKRVSKELKTQEDTANETLWTIGTTLAHKAWQPDKAECGAGKFHACSHPVLCDQYREKAGDKYISISVAVKDLFAWDNGEHPNKIAFRKGKVLHECDRDGNKV